MSGAVTYDCSELLLTIDSVRLAASWGVNDEKLSLPNSVMGGRRRGTERVDVEETERLVGEARALEMDEEACVVEDVDMFGTFSDCLSTDRRASDD